MSANIIPFPNRRHQAEEGLARLNRAMDALVAAMDHQQRVTRDYRDTVTVLDTAVQDLGGSLQRYGGALSTLGAAVLVVRDESDRLADSMGRACAA